MKFFFIFLTLITATIYAKPINTVLESSLKENDLSSDAILTLESPLESKNIFISYNKDLIIITLQNTMMVKKQAYPKTTDKRILRTLVHSPSLNRVDYRIRFKNAKLVKPELNEIQIKKNKVIVKLFKSQKDMLLFHLQEKNNNKTKALPVKMAKSITTIDNNKKPININGKKALTSSKEKLKTNAKIKSALSPKANKEPLIASPAPNSFNSIMFIILLFLGAIAFFLKKRNGNLSLANNESVKILSTKSLGNKKQLIMVEANGNKLLLATSENGVQVLSGLNDHTEENEELEYLPKKRNKKEFKTELDEEIDELERSFFQKKTKKNPYIQEEEPEVVTHFSKKLKNIKKL